MNLACPTFPSPACGRAVRGNSMRRHEMPAEAVTCAESRRPRLRNLACDVRGPLLSFPFPRARSVGEGGRRLDEGSFTQQVGIEKHLLCRQRALIRPSGTFSRRREKGKTPSPRQVFHSPFLVSDITLSTKARKIAETTKAMCMMVSHMIWSDVYWAEFRNTCSRWIEEMATIVEATFTFSDPASILPSQ